ncbi:MAG: DNA-processing protein DprA [bacterium]
MILKITDKEYPELLKRIYDPPEELYIKGNASVLNSRCIAIVGTRTATNYGKEIARRFSYELAQCGFTVVSGLAEGIDTEAHIGALEAGGKTVAVFGCGIDRIFPPQNIGLSEDIEKSGALVSEYKPGTPAAKWTFPRRNRIISGLSLGVVMVEGHWDSGAMITAKLALDEGREVFAVPGNIAIDQTKGPHWLIKHGAKLVENVDDILEEFNVKRVAGPSRRGLAEVDGEVKKGIDHSQLSSDEVKIISCLTKEPKHVDEISAESKTGSHETLGVLSVLEIKGLVKQMPGKYFVIC